MSAEGDGTQFTLLGRIDGVDPSGLTERYAYPEPDPDAPRSCWVRGNMIASVDGGATSAGKSGDLGGDGDRALFAGAARARRRDRRRRVHGAGGELLGRPVQRRATPGTSAPRAGRGTADRRADPVGPGDRDAKLFHSTEVAPLILTSADAADDTRRRLGGLAEVLDASGADTDSVDLRTALDLLAERGLLRVLTEGGPGVLGMFTEQDVLDELCLTVAPVLVGGEAGRIVTGPAEVHTTMRLRHALTDDDGYLYLRYTRRGPARSGAAQ